MSTPYVTRDSHWPYPLPQYVCPHCWAFLAEAPFDPQAMLARCPVCAGVYRSSAASTAAEVGAYLQAQGCALAFKDALSHSRQLAILAACARGFQAAPHAAQPPYVYSPLRVVLEALHHAQQCVHILTQGLSPHFLGALTLTALRVAVRGVVVSDDPKGQDMIQQLDTVPRLQLRVCPVPKPAPLCQSLVVVDGLLAFLGTTHLTVEALQQAATTPERFVVLTDVPEIRRLHNHLISSIGTTQCHDTAVGRQVLVG